MVQQLRNLRVAIGGRRILPRLRVGIAQHMRQLLLLRLHRAQLVEHGQTLIEHRSPRQRQPILRQIAQRHALDVRALAIVQRL
jgi:hypothetical protein